MNKLLYVLMVVVLIVTFWMTYLSVTASCEGLRDTKIEYVPKHCIGEYRK